MSDNFLSTVYRKDYVITKLSSEKNKKSKEVQLFSNVTSDLPNEIASCFNRPMTLQKHRKMFAHFALVETGLYCFVDVSIKNLLTLE